MLSSFMGFICGLCAVSTLSLCMLVVIDMFYLMAMCYLLKMSDFFCIIERIESFGCSLRKLVSSVNI